MYMLIPISSFIPPPFPISNHKFVFSMSEKSTVLIQALKSGTSNILQEDILYSYSIRFPVAAEKFFKNEWKLWPWEIQEAHKESS